jgi:hypothetical protein
LPYRIPKLLVLVALLVWYRRFLYAVESDHQYPNAGGLASSGNLYDLGRFVNVHVSTVLAVFRTTGDLQLLDDVDVVMQRARAALADHDGDGFLNWRWLQNPNNADHYGRDVHVMDETMAHGLVAAVAWAFETNRELDSPSGVDYGDRADFWRSYLVDHFQPKWRARDLEPDGYSYLYNELMHPYLQRLRYAHYMALLTGDDGHRLEAERLADVLRSEFRRVDSELGPAVVWSQGIQGADSYVHYLQPTIYAGYTALTVYELSREGVAPFDESEMLAQISRALAAFVVDNGASDFAADVGGNRAQAGLDPAPLFPEDPWGFARMTDEQYAIQAFGVLEPFDDSGELREIDRTLYEQLEERERPQRIYLPAVAFLDLVSR